MQIWLKLIVPVSPCSSPRDNVALWQSGTFPRSFAMFVQVREASDADNNAAANWNEYSSMAHESE